MHVIIDLHSLPGGVNDLDISETFGHTFWFNNQTNLDYSYAAVDAVLAFMKSSGHLNSFTISPLNEAADNLDKFSMPKGLSQSSADWILKYMNGVLAKVDAVNPRIPVMLQDSFQGAAFWAPKFAPRPNLVMDVHVYYFAVPDAFARYLVPKICSQSCVVSADKKFPTFVGEGIQEDYWSYVDLINASVITKQTPSRFC